MGSAFYTGVGPVLSRYELDVQACSLTKVSKLVLPTNVQYAWPHTTRPVLYVACSSRTSRTEVGNQHSAHAIQVDPASGAMSLLGPALRLPHRAVHTTCDSSSAHLLLATNQPASVIVTRINDDGSLGPVVPQRPGIDAGIFPHQVRVTDDNRFCVLVTRGNPGTRGWWAHTSRQSDPGALMVFEYTDGTLGEQSVVTVGDGYDFGPRHLDFHPTRPWVYVCLETQNEAMVFERTDTGLSPTPRQRLSTLDDPDDVLVRQGAGTVHVHPRGHAVYFANRGHTPIPQRNGLGVLRGVDNSLVVYAIDETTGLLTEIQRIDSGGICPRTFGIDPTGRMLVAANAETHWVKHGHETRRVPANLTTFRIHEDGRLERRHRYDVELAPGRTIVWSGVAPF